MLSHFMIMSSFSKLDHSITPTSFNCFADPELVFSCELNICGSVHHA